MSNTTAVDPFIVTLNIIQLNLLRYGYSIFCVIGNIGCILNILILTQRNHRQNSCSCYILANTIINFISINLYVVFRYLTDFNYAGIKTVLYCKIYRYYVVQASVATARIYIVLACIDRWALTSRSVRIRAFAQMKVAKILIICVPIIWSVITIHVPFYQDIVQGQCVYTSKDYEMFYNIYNTIVTGLIIPISMIVFSVLCIRNVKQLQQRVYVHTQVPNIAVVHAKSATQRQSVAFMDAQNRGQGTINKKHQDYQLIFMIIVQICVYIITNIPYTAYLLYSAITLNWIKSSRHSSIDNFLNSIVLLLVYLNFSVTFYIYTLTSSTFRKDLKRLLYHNRLMNIMFGNRQIQEF